MRAELPSGAAVGNPIDLAGAGELKVAAAMARTVADAGIPVVVHTMHAAREAPGADSGLDLKRLHAKSALVKVAASEAAGRVVDRCVQVFGGRGLLTLPMPAPEMAAPAPTAEPVAAPLGSGAQDAGQGMPHAQLLRRDQAVGHRSRRQPPEEPERRQGGGGEHHLDPRTPSTETNLGVTTSPSVIPRKIAIVPSPVAVGGAWVRAGASGRVLVVEA